MQTRFSLMIVLGLLLLPEIGFASLDHWHVVRHIVLGKTAHTRLSATVEFDNWGPGGFHGFGGFFVVFQSRPSRHGKRIVVFHGQGLLSNLKIEAQDFIHRGRKQLFVSCAMGEVYNVIYDYDGKHVRKIYDSGGGRLQVTPVKIKHGTWEIIEEWAIYHYNDDNLGVAFKTKDNGVLRTLVWRHGQFVPKFPGPTLIKNLIKRLGRTGKERQSRLKTS